jgi:hypothetical protein
MVSDGKSSVTPRVLVLLGRMTSVPAAFMDTISGKVTRRLLVPNTKASDSSGFKQRMF